ncbi:carbohydrate esterase family 1 protein [Thermothelomyces thermophilus ATCC 42464]|uniref:Carbohydrate esterase family 1 protein n=1 Tax=Thermothelomyces thermophilus (strain ATCC 42464 / BCRC 31852 / DSM 1799) TaxID=573729 RepID=G2QQD6_THET4|nr:carbohydrate esterase family 1 protein [Thermothelomyces thermophilus ATCC 42464]AEO61799.1 carbohydrate esterase family 1 protein [Thermothelomyces thermophilus ATCC 42464]
MVTVSSLVAAAGVVLLAGQEVFAVQLTRVDYPNNATSRAEMYIYVPDNVVESPPLVVVVLLGPGVLPKRGDPVAAGVGQQGVHHAVAVVSERGGGGDSQAIADMILHAVAEYGADAARVYLTGGSSGAMMGNVHGRDVAAWNNTCSGGRSRASPEQWGNVVRDMYPGYEGPRPKMQIWHGSADSTLAPANYEETIKQWTNVFGVSQEPTNSVENYPAPNYRTDDYGENVQGIFANGVGHSVPANLTASEAWFGL